MTWGLLFTPEIEGVKSLPRGLKWVCGLLYLSVVSEEEEGWALVIASSVCMNDVVIQAPTVVCSEME